MHYEFWRNWLIYPYHFPFAVAPIPELIHSEILFVAGELGLALAQEAWIKPGITTDEMIATAAGYDHLDELSPDVQAAYRKALDLLDERFLMSSQNDNWYLTGRNPSRQLQKYASERGYEIIRGGSASWSKLFG